MRRSLLLRGQMLAQEGKRDEAITQLKAAAAVDPNSASLQFALGRSYAAEGDMEQARHAYGEVLRFNPRAAGAQVELARLDLMGGKVDSSIQFSREAIRNEPSNLDAQIALIRGLLSSRDIAAAERMLGPLLQQHPRVAALHVQRALAFAAKTDPRPLGDRSSGARRHIPGPDALGGLVALESARGNHAAASRHNRTNSRHDLPRRSCSLSLPERMPPPRTWHRLKRSFVRPSKSTRRCSPDMSCSVSSISCREESIEASKEFESLAARQAKPIAALTMLGMIAQAQKDLRPRGAISNR